MRGLQAQLGNVLVTPSGDYYPRELEVSSSEMRIIERVDGVLEVHDPLFEEPYCIGDRSLIKDETADAFVRLHVEHFLLHGSTRQLSNTEPYETKAGTGRWSRLQHMVSSTALTALYDGTPLQIMQSAIHDDGHRIGSHRVDDILLGRGKENAHDEALTSFILRSGFPEKLIRAGLIDEQYSFLKLEGVTLHDLLDRSTQALGITHWPSRTGNLETERLQYIVHELGIWAYDPSVMRKVLSHIYRDPETPEGDQLVFNNVEAATLLTVGQIRCQTEHWCEPVNEIVDELSNVMWCYALTSGSPAAAAYNQYFLGDSFYTLEEDWQKTVQNLGGRHGAFMSGLTKICDKLCDLQRQAHAEIDGEQRVYAGPIVPDWLRIQDRLRIPNDVRQGVSFHRAKRLGGDVLFLEMEHAKPRAIDPWVKLPGKAMQRVSYLNPSIKVFQARQSQWSGKAYQAQINLGHPALGLTPAEQKAMQRGLAEITQKWPSVLERPAMPAEEFQAWIARASARYREIGSLPTTSMLRAA